MTGRKDRSGFRYRIPELLQQVGLKFDEVHLSEGDTASFKAGLISKLLGRHRIIDTVHIWDDKKAHLAHFARVAEKAGISPENIHTHHVRHMAKEPLCDGDDLVFEAPDQKISYVGVFLDAKSKAKLVHEFPPIHPSEKAEHMTIAFRPKPGDDILDMVDTKVRLKVVGYAEDEKGQAVVVQPSPSVGRDRTPHITISVASGVPPKYSNELISGPSLRRVSGPTLEGVVDTYPRSLSHAVARQGSVMRVAFRYLSRRT